MRTAAMPTPDPLTELGDRRYFEHHSRDWMCAQKAPFIVALIDVDELQLLNQQYGFAVGDAALRLAARVLGYSVRKDDLLARIGGDEFVLLMGGLTLETGRRHLALVLDVMRSGALDTLTGRTGVGISASCGMTAFSSGDTLASLLDRANDALSTAKRTRRGRVVARPAQ